MDVRFPRRSDHFFHRDFPCVVPICNVLGQTPALYVGKGGWLRMGWLEFGNGLGENNNGGIGMGWVKIGQNSLPDP